MLRTESEDRMAKKFIQRAIKHPGALRRQLGVKKGHLIPAGALAKAAKKGGTLGRRARFAQTLRRLAAHRRHHGRARMASGY